jgi:hypothetical protein
MKSIRTMAVVRITLIVVFALAFIANAQEKKITKKDVPVAVLSAFEKAYPKAKVKGYSTETEDGKTYFEIESMQGKMNLDASYLPDGTVAEIESGVAVKNLPIPVKDAVKAKYPKGKIDKAEQKTVGAVVTFEIKVKVGKSIVGLEIDPSGKIIKESKAKAKKEEKN